MIFFVIFWHNYETRRAQWPRADTKAIIDDFHERAQFVKNYTQLKLLNNSQTIERAKVDMCRLCSEQSLAYTLLSICPRI